MILEFADKIGVNETNFVEKIYETILQKGISVNAWDVAILWRRFLPVDYKVGTHRCKLHTIRKDIENNFEKNTIVTFYTSKDSQKPHVRFAPDLCCTGVQTIEITYPTEYMNDCVIKVDGKKLSIDEMQQLAWNDGFCNLAFFQMYFNYDFKGKIIHWTNVRY